MLRDAADAVRKHEGAAAAGNWLRTYAAAPFAGGAAFDSVASAWTKDDPAAAAGGGVNVG